MRYRLLNEKALSAVRRKPRAKIHPPPPSRVVIRVTNHIAHLGHPKEGPKPRQLLSLPPFPGHHLPGRKSASAQHVTAISWLKYYFDDIPPPIIQNHFNKGLVQMECYQGRSASMRKFQIASLYICNSYAQINPSDVMEEGDRVYVPVSVAESKISKRFDVIPSGTLNPNADEIEYLRRLDSAILVLNKPPKLPVKGSVPVHNSMDALAAAALSYDYEEGPKLVHRLDRESSGLLLMGRTKESISYLHWLFSDVRKAKPLSKDWNDAREAMYQKYWALVIGVPKQKEGIICAPLTKVLLDDGETERVILSHNSGLEASQEAITEYRVLGPTINGCSWIELHPLTRCKHQLRVHCAEALGTPIVGDHKYGWFVHNRWKQMPRVDFEPTSGKPYRLKRPEGLDVQKGSVLSKVPLLHLHCREMVLPNVAKFIELHRMQCHAGLVCDSRADVLRFVASITSHMKISWNLMSSYLV
ncbi:pseudouridine synthase family protein [Striga asiatica]|uniref:Pseudouridine synthase family protein n=1 Tax=Striga asiatica TaxID=4170 RepID=A0A5A7Q4Z3_STRAF|nr:pseudouridine synthase family protein [Striga asiatica]